MASGAMFNFFRAKSFPSPGEKVCRSTPGATTKTLSGHASYKETNEAASASVLAINPVDAFTTCASPSARIFGSGFSPTAKFKFFTFAMVCIV